jgi:multiple sugar transport system substrate-binding protein
LPAAAAGKRQGRDNLSWRWAEASQTARTPLRAGSLGKKPNTSGSGHVTGERTATNYRRGDKNDDTALTASLLGATFLLLGTPAGASDGTSAERRIQALRVNPHAPVIDGVLDEEVWREAPASGDFTQRDPDENAPASEKTSIQLAYDDEAGDPELRPWRAVLKSFTDAGNNVFYVKQNCWSSIWRRWWTSALPQTVHEAQLQGDALMMDHRRWIAGLASFSFAALMVGCAGIEGVDPGDQQLVFWHQHTGEQESVLGGLINEFNRDNAFSIQVHGKYAGDHAAIYDSMLGARPASLPQLVVAYQNQAQDYVRADRIVDLKPYMESPRWGLSGQDRDDFLPTLLDQDQSQGLQLALRPHFSMEVLYYNEDWLADLGFAGPPASWDEFAQMCRLARDLPFSRATDPSRSLGFVLEEDASRLASMVFSRGGALINSWHRAYTFNTPAMRFSLSLLRELKEERALALTPDAAASEEAFCTGQALFITGSSSHLSAVSSGVTAGAGFAWNVDILPGERGIPPVGNIYGASIAVCRSTPETQLAAWLFVKWFTEPSQQKRWVQGSSYFPVRTSAAATLDPFFANVFRLMETGRPEPRVAGYQRVRRMMTQSMNTVLAGGNMRQALSMLEERANRTLAR